MSPSCPCYWGRGIGSSLGIRNRVAIRGLLLRWSPWLNVASGRGHSIWLTHRSRYRRVPGVTLLEGPTVNVPVRFPLSESGSGETASVAGPRDSTAGDMVRGHALWLFVFRWRFRVVARRRLMARVGGGVLSVEVACTREKQPIAGCLRHIRRSIRYADPPLHTVAIPRCGGPEN